MLVTRKERKSQRRNGNGPSDRTRNSIIQSNTGHFVQNGVVSDSRFATLDGLNEDGNGTPDAGGDSPVTFLNRLPALPRIKTN